METHPGPVTPQVEQALGPNTKTVRRVLLSNWDKGKPRVKKLGCRESRPILHKHLQRLQHQVCSSEWILGKGATCQNGVTYREELILWMEEILNYLRTPVNTNKQWLQPWFQTGAKWISSIHGVEGHPFNTRKQGATALTAQLRLASPLRA